MASNIRAISTGTDTSDATATAAQILSGYTAYVKGNKLTGTASGFPTKASISGGGGVLSGASASLSGSELTVRGSARSQGNFGITITLS